MEAWDPARAAQFVGELVIGQIGLATPLVFLLCIAGVVIAVRRAWRSRDHAGTLLAALTVPPALVFIEHALGDRVQGNWPAVIYPAAVIAAAGAGAGWWGRLWRPAVVLGLGITALVYVQAALAPIPLPAVLDPSAQRLAGWDALASAVDEARRAEGVAFVAADQYGVATELARMLANANVVGVGTRWRSLDLPHGPLAGAALLVRDGRAGDPVGWSRWQEVGRAARARDGVVIQWFRLFRVWGSTEPQASLPRP